ncbi:MAG: KEOPS complex subunit Pcc1, partial [Nitrososphaerales archaeon]
SEIRGGSKVFNCKTTGIPEGGRLAISESKVNKLKSSLVIGFSDAKTLHAINASLTPDNISFPDGMKFSQSARASELKIKIDIESSKENQFEMLISTLDEIVLHVYSATNVIEKTEKL